MIQQLIGNTLLRYFLEAPEGIWNELQMEEKDILQSAKWGVWDSKLLWKFHGLHYESFWLIFSICSYAVVIHDVSIKINTAMLESTRHMVKCGSSLFKSLVGVSECVIVCWLLLPLVLLYSSQSVWPEFSVTCSQLPGVWNREKRAGWFGLWAGSAGKDEKKMWAWVKECCCKQTSFVIPVIQRASSQHCRPCGVFSGFVWL